MSHSQPLLDLHDIQGNIVKAYPRFGMPKARYLFFRVNDGAAGRAFVGELARIVTTSAMWMENARRSDEKPPSVAINVAFTYEGLRRLGVPPASLQSFPPEFAGGMRSRWEILGDDGASAPEKWDPIWRRDEPVHIFVTISAATQELLETQQAELCSKVIANAVELLTGHRGGDRDDLAYQDGTALYENGQPTAKEHFGYTDGISNPFFKGVATHSSNVIGGGKRVRGDIESEAGWAPLEPGEFLLGYKDEAQELPPAPIPWPLSDNGTFLVYRKLHENVGSFDRYLETVGMTFPGGKEALAAKLAGRWRNGAPVTTFRTEAEANDFSKRWEEARLAISRAKAHEERERAKATFAKLNTKFVAFDFGNDIDGGGCPMGAHTRRAHPRVALEFGVEDAFEGAPDALANRRRMIRRGLPYGSTQNGRDDQGDHGIIFMALVADIERQFEFVQQQWLNYGNDFRLANEKDAITGNHGVEADGSGEGVMTVQSDPKSPQPPFFCAKLPRFVETRGGDYFFVPSLTALRMIADGIIDPT
jgi:Dyp-type peroxidase family